MAAFTAFVNQNKKAIFFAIFLIGFSVFFRVLFNGFVWDDNSYIINNDQEHVFNIIQLFSTNSFNNAGYYRPIPAVYFSYLYQVFHNHAFGYHFMQIILHFLDVCLLYLFLKEFFKKGIAFFLSLLFLIHPINVESVAYIGASQSELYFLFGISALLLLKKYKETPFYHLAYFLLLLLLILTKEVGLVFFPLLLLFRYLFQHKKVVSLVVIEGIVLVVYAYIRFILFNTPLEKISMIPIAQVPLLERLLSVPRIVAYYFQTLLWPQNLAVDQHWVITSPSVANFFLPLLFDTIILGAMIYGGFLLYRSHKTYFRFFLFFFCWFSFSMAFLIQIFPLDMTVAERWFYLPFVGILGMLGILWQSFAIRINKKAAVIFICCILLALSIRTIVRTGDFRDELTLFSHDLTVSDNFDLRNDLAVTLGQQKRNAEAIQQVKKSIAEKRMETNVTNLAVFYEHSGDRKKAEKYYLQSFHEKSFTIDYNLHHHEYNTYLNAAIFFMDNDNKKAEEILKAGVADYPEAKRLWLLLTKNQWELGKKTEALNDAAQAYKVSPDTETAKAYAWLLYHVPH